MRNKKLKRLKAYKQLVKNLMEEKLCAKGLLGCSDKHILNAIEKEVLKEISDKIKEHENKTDRYEYVAPNLYRSRLEKDYNIKQLYNLKYVLVTNIGTTTFSILSDTENIRIGIIKKGITYRKQLFTNRTLSEDLAWLIFKQCHQIKSLPQRAFYICGSLYFADFYFPKFKTIIEIDGDYHNTLSQKIKDQKRTEFFKSVGIKVIRIKNEEVKDSLMISQILLELSKQSKK